MPIIKTAGYFRKDLRLAELAKALSHPARVAILRHLAKSPDCVCGDIVDTIPLAQATVSQHLKELKKVGLIKGEIDGPRSCYCVNSDTMNEALEMLSAFLTTMNCCQPALKRIAGKEVAT